jgi:hypothetical protein
MTNQSLPDDQGLSEQAAPHDLAAGNTVPTPTEHDSKWQKHVITFLWIVIAVVIVLGIVFAIGETHGFFRSGADEKPSWPAGWP